MGRGCVVWQASGAGTLAEQGLKPGVPLGTAGGRQFQDPLAFCIGRAAPIPDFIQAPAAAKTYLMLVQTAVADAWRWQSPIHDSTDDQEKDQINQAIQQQQQRR
jgi:hypothetical protein